MASVTTRVRRRNVRSDGGHTTPRRKGRTAPSAPLVCGLPAALITCPRCRHSWPVSDGIGCPACDTLITLPGSATPAAGPADPGTCPDCGDGLFEFDGERLCPTCIDVVPTDGDDDGPDGGALPLSARVVPADLRKGA